MLGVATSVVFFGAYSHAQDYGTLLREHKGGEVTFEPMGPGVLFGALDPAVKKWYIPQFLFREYQWRQWEYTNYAREHYERYVDIALEGNYFYDFYGNFTTRGWLIYDWHQDQPVQFGSGIFKDERYANWFNRVLIASDSKGEYHTAITIGDQIRTTLTPMTFSKPAFNGMQMDFASDKYAGTILLSRVSFPGIGRVAPPFEKTSSTNFTGLRGTVQIGDFVKVGATYANAHNIQTLLEAFQGNPMSGSLSVEQNSRRIEKLVIRLSDDSPEDGEGGAALFGTDILIEDVKGNKVRGNDIGFKPLIEGGLQRQGFLAADGNERILLTYDLTDLSYNGPDPSLIKKVGFELILGNDYEVEWTSDRQTNKGNQPVFLPIERAKGNVRDLSNLTIVTFDYGLPTANEIAGITLEANDISGFDLYAEFDRNRRFRKYPNVNRKTHHTASDRSDAWMVNVSKRGYQWFLFGETYSMDDDYSTTTFIVSADGSIDYEDKRASRFEFVEDNDDQDAIPDGDRAFQLGPDSNVFPGWDENNDFISDFNQNDNPVRPNLVPDYEEPFLRYNVDRPEFLFGVDMNNNMWIDRFENDEEPDYPYPRNHRGYNTYIGTHITPEMRLTAGQIRDELIADNRRNITSYLFFTLDHDDPRLGRLRIFENMKLSKDTIPDNLFQWVQPQDSRGEMQRIQDPLPAQDTWINSSFLQFDYRGIRHVNIINKVKYDLWKQKGERTTLRDRSSFFGVISKIDRLWQTGTLGIHLKAKNELRLDTPVLQNNPARKEDTVILTGIVKFPFLRYSRIETGVEYTIFNQLQAPVPFGLRDDFRGLVLALQYTNAANYLGYKLTTQLGFKASRMWLDDETETGTTTFVTVYAG
ncbi:MAG: hypothetical protein HY709_02595, partial [Candidatus Latescibacteria bacterium]|nr:hypothetical protein [Candidatus Latescibacterota bacterium]